VRVVTVTRTRLSPARLVRPPLSCPSPSPFVPLFASKAPTPPGCAIRALSGSRFPPTAQVPVDSDTALPRPGPCAPLHQPTPLPRRTLGNPALRHRPPLLPCAAPAPCAVTPLRPVLRLPRPAAATLLLRQRRQPGLVTQSAAGGGSRRRRTGPVPDPENRIRIHDRPSLAKTRGDHISRL
jgi:hypothetical protein